METNDKKILSRLPSFFRSPDGKRPTREMIEKYIDNLKKDEGL